MTLKNNMIYIGVNETLLILDTAANYQWSFAAEGYLSKFFSESLDGTIYVGSDDGYLYALQN